MVCEKLVRAMGKITEQVERELEAGAVAGGSPQ